MIPISDDELRTLVRDAIARVRATPAGRPVAVDPSSPAMTNERSAAAAGTPQVAHVHASHALVVFHGGAGDADGNCVIEPSVRCTHCGYCQSYGH